jgi:hypothetical protein
LIVSAKLYASEAGAIVEKMFLSSCRNVEICNSYAEK